MGNGESIWVQLVLVGYHAAVPVVASGGHGGQHAGCLDEEGVWGPLWQGVVAHEGGGAYNPQGIAERLALEEAMCETVCRCSGRCKCKAPAPKFQWMRRAEMAKCWKYIVPKLTAAGVVALSLAVSSLHTSPGPPLSSPSRRVPRTRAGVVGVRIYADPACPLGLGWRLCIFIGLR